jgi:hypothetical protein
MTSQSAGVWQRLYRWVIPLEWSLFPNATERALPIVLASYSWFDTVGLVRFLFYLATETQATSNGFVFNQRKSEDRNTFLNTEKHNGDTSLERKECRKVFYWTMLWTDRFKQQINETEQRMSEVWNRRKMFPGATSLITHTKTHFDTISYRNVQRKDTANLQFVTRRYFYRFHMDIYFGEKIFCRYSICTRIACKSWVMETALLRISRLLIKNNFGAWNNKKWN